MIIFIQSLRFNLSVFEVEINMGYNRGLRSCRCGDCMVLILMALLILTVTLLYFNQSELRSLYESQMASARDSEVWQGGSMRKGGLKKAPSNKRAAKIQNAIERLGMQPIPDTRPDACQKKFVDFPKSPKIRVGIAIVPSDPIFSVNKLQTTIVSLLATTSSYYKLLDVGLIATDAETAETLRQSFESLTTRNKPNFRVIERKELFEKETLFKELLHVAAAEFLQSDVIIFITAGMQCNMGWFEAFIDPIVSGGSKPPMIISPVVNRQSGNVSEYTRLLFNWRLAPKFVQQKSASVNAVPSLMFLPQSFAINRKSERFNRLYSFISQHNINDPTVFDAAMFFARCLNVKVVSAPCARLSMANGLIVESEFDPHLKSAADTKKRLVSTWLSEYRSKFEEVFGKSRSLLDSPAHCKKLSDVVSQDDLNEMFAAPEDSDGLYYYLASLAGTTFLPTNGELRAQHCPFPDSPEAMFKQTANGYIATPSGICVTSPPDGSYVELHECSREINPHQQWEVMSDGKLKNKATGHCMLHATDPKVSTNNGETLGIHTQVLMMSDCSLEDSNFMKFTFAKTC